MLFADAWVANTGILNCSARSCTAPMTELWNWPRTATTWSWVASFLNPATPFSGVPESSSMTSSILRPPRTPPLALISSAPILAPRTMNWPALASPGGESGVSTPILTVFWARAGAAPVARASTASAQIVSSLFIGVILQTWWLRRAFRSRLARHRMGRGAQRQGLCHAASLSISEASAAGKS